MGKLISVYLRLIWISAISSAILFALTAELFYFAIVVVDVFELIFIPKLTIDNQTDTNE